MHESSLGNTLRDYLTGEEIEETTYEEFRQALARMLVEEFGYPRESLKARVRFIYEIDGTEHHADADILVSSPEGVPLLLLQFCPGEVGSYERETVSLARLLADKPLPLALCTDTRDASLLDVASGECLASGMRAIPYWDDLLKLADERQTSTFDGKKRQQLIRLFHAYNGLHAGCCNNECSIS